LQAKDNEIKQANEQVQNMGQSVITEHSVASDDQELHFINTGLL
jgi:hypothetical protein